MPIDRVHHLDVTPALRDVLDNLHEAAIKRYDSGWTRLLASATVSFTHGLREIPMVLQVLESTDPTAGRVMTTGAYPCKGFVDQRMVKIPGTLTRQRVPVITITGGSLPSGIAPQSGDSVTIQGKTYQVEVDDTDAANAVHTITTPTR
mgnify:CR=1 FL=1